MQFLKGVTLMNRDGIKRVSSVHLTNLKANLLNTNCPK